MVQILPYSAVAHLTDAARTDGVTIEDDPATEWFGYALPDGRVVAAGGLKELLPGMFRLRGAFTLPAFRALGIGGLLSASRIQRATERGAVVIETHSKHPPFYLAQGWMDSGERTASGAWVLRFVLTREVADDLGIHSSAS